MYNAQIPKPRIVLITLVSIFFAGGSVSLALRSPAGVYALSLPTNTPVLREATKIPEESLNIDGIDGPEMVTDLNNNGLPDPGDTVRYTIRYSNSGRVALENILLANEYDKTAISTIANISAGGELDADKGVITWNLGNLSSAVKGSVSFEATFNPAFDPNGSLQIKNTATISSLQDGAAQVSISLSHFLELRIPQLRLSKEMKLVTDSNNNGLPDPGDTVGFTITLRNIGSVEAEAVSIQDDYDQVKLGQPSDISNNGQSDGDLITWSHPQLEPGGEISDTYNINLSPSLPLGNSSIVNTVSASGRGINPITAENRFDIEVVPSPTPAVVLPTATPEPSFKPAGPTGETISASSQAGLAIAFMLLALGGLLAIGTLALRKIPIPTTLRDGFILSLVMGTVIILGLAGSVERSAIAGLIGTVAGYVLRSVSETKGK